MSGLDKGQLIDASANLNPLGPPQWLDAAFLEGRRECGAYPEPTYSRLRETAAKALGTDPDKLVFGNGADELIFAISRCTGQRTHALIDPCYSSYRESALAAGRTIVSYPTWSAALYGLASAPEAIVWLGAPNNPDGKLPPGYPHSVATAAAEHKNALFAVDESFIDFSDGADPAESVHVFSSLPNIVLIRSMTKYWCVPGIRCGWIHTAPDRARLIRAAIPSWPLNSVAEAFARRAFTDPDAQGRRQRTLALIQAERSRMTIRLGALPGLELQPSKANFYLLRIDPAHAPMDAATLADRAALEGIGFRRCIAWPGLGPDWLRVALRTPEENDRIAECIERLLGSRIAPKAAYRKRKPALMVAGTSSGAGKSLITAALCRIFRNDGLDVAPYKAQNMALNSALSPDGLELGRAQAVQAAACGLEPDVRMNPVLLKPEHERGSQVILMGRSIGSMEARDYYAIHDRVKETARSAYDSLASEHSLIVMEGAGSPAEINLKARDIVNMSAAVHAGARVLLVGDIDRGGVFASFIGHAACMLPQELALFSGFLVNKFRGDPALLGDAFAMTRDRSGIPVLGCVPMLNGIDIPEEDEANIRATGRPNAPIKIAVAALPHGSNLTDLDPFVADDDVELCVLGSGQELAARNWDALIIPGSKSTVSDLAWLASTGLAHAIREHARAGGTVVGICGGFQMLGRSIEDPLCIESSTGPVPGLDLIPVATSMALEKTLRQGCATILGDASGLRPRGYEIHHGKTVALSEAAVPFMRSEAGDIIAYRHGQAWGCYLHGLFDDDATRAWFLNGIRAARGMAPRSPTRYRSLDERLQNLADAVRPHIDMNTLYKDLGL